MIARTLFDEVVLIDLQGNPAEILEKVHQKIDMIFHKDIYNNSEIETGMDVALCVCSYKPEQANVEVTFCGAKRPLFYVLPNSQNTKVVQGSRKSIGGRQNKNFENQHLILPLNTMLYLCSDGYADQNNTARENFGLVRFQQLLGEISILPVVEQYQILENELQNFMQGTEQRDDIVVWGVRL
jgi:serine phosphatase RsbU (regulator of sigma subunit)